MHGMHEGLADIFHQGPRTDIWNGQLGQPSGMGHLGRSSGTAIWDDGQLPSSSRVNHHVEARVKARTGSNPPIVLVAGVQFRRGRVWGKSRATKSCSRTGRLNFTQFDVMFGFTFAPGPALPCLVEPGRAHNMRRDFSRFLDAGVHQGTAMGCRRTRGKGMNDETYRRRYGPTAKGDGQKSRYIVVLYLQRTRPVAGPCIVGTKLLCSHRLSSNITSKSPLPRL